MDDSAAILCQISSLKDMLDQVNEEIEANFQITRVMESEIVKHSELESTLAIRESELTKMVFMLQFEINGLIAVTAHSRMKSKCSEQELSFLGLKQDELYERMNKKREVFSTLCLNFQKDIEKGDNDELRRLLVEKDDLENEVVLLKEKISSLENSVSAFLEEILEDLHHSNSDLHVEIRRSNLENEKLLKDINELKTTLLSTFSTPVHMNTTSDKNI